MLMAYAEPCPDPEALKVVGTLVKRLPFAFCNRITQFRLLRLTIVSGRC